MTFIYKTILIVCIGLFLFASCFLLINKKYGLSVDLHQYEWSGLGWSEPEVISYSLRAIEDSGYVSSEFQPVPDDRSSPSEKYIVWWGRDPVKATVKFSNMFNQVNLHVTSYKESGKVYCEVSRDK